MGKRNIRLNIYFFWLLIAIINILLPTILLINLPQYYLLRFDYYEVYDSFRQIGINKEVVIDNFVNLIRFFSPFGNDLNLEFYSKEDLIHLQDVRNIISFFYVLFALSLGMLYSTRKQVLSKPILCQMSIYSRNYIIVSALVATIVILKFNTFFTIAHDLVFFNDYWLLDPKTSNLIKFFPESLFLEIFVLIIILHFLMHLSFIMLVRKYYGRKIDK